MLLMGFLLKDSQAVGKGSVGIDEISSAEPVRIRVCTRALRASPPRPWTVNKSETIHVLLLVNNCFDVIPTPLFVAMK